MSDHVNGIAFAALALAALGGSLGMLMSRNIVHAAYWLLEVCVATGGIYFLLEADYVAVVQLLIYAGALAILLIFTIMVTLRGPQDALRSRDLSVPAAALALVFFALVASAVVGWRPEAVALPDTMPTVAELGEALFDPERWALHFEVASLVLTAALVAAVLWSREGGDE